VEETYVDAVMLQEKDDRSSSRGSLYAPRQSELNELRQQADVYRSRMKECRSQTDMLIAQRNGEHRHRLLTM